MGSMWLALRPGARRDWRALLGLALLLGLMGGVALTAAAGARRTETAFPRLLRLSHASSQLVTPSSAAIPGPAASGYFTALGRLPQVATMAVTDYLDMTLPGPGGRASGGRPVVAEASPDGAGLRVDRVKVLSGRLPNPADPHAVMIGQYLAHAAHLRPGSTLHLIAFPQRNGNRIRNRSVRLAFRVTAVIAFDDQILPAARGRQEPRALLGPAFARTPAARSFNPAAGAASVVLRPGGVRGGVLPGGGEPGPGLPGRQGGCGPAGHRLRGNPAGHPAGGGRAGDLRRAGRAHRARAHHPVAQPPAVHAGG